MVSSQVNLHREYFEELLAQVPAGAHQTDLLLLHLCSNSILKKLEEDHLHKRTSKPFSKLCYRCRGDEVFSYPEILESAKFCLVSRGGRLGQPVLYDALRSGCVPVVVADTLVLPFSEVLDWRTASVQIYEDDLPDLLQILEKDVSADRLENLQKQVLFFFSQYFSSVKAITLTALDLLNERIFATSRRSTHDWNTRPQDRVPNNPLFLPLTVPSDEGFTAVILTYDRLDSLIQVIHTLRNVPSCVKVLVVWNNQKKDPPQGR